MSTVVSKLSDKGSINVARTERLISGALGSALLLTALSGRGAKRLTALGVGSALVYRGFTGHCHAYEALGIDTACGATASDLDRVGVEVSECFLVAKPVEDLYRFWRHLGNLPRFMSHLKEVEALDERRSRWTAAAPLVAGGLIQWDAEIVEDIENQRLAWRTLPESSVDHRGSVEFSPAPGERGVYVRVELTYAPPGGQAGRWIAKLFGEAPEQQVRSDLRKFKRLMEAREIPTIEGQSHASCYGLGQLLHS
ncbi:Polyketide cyclase / dehydrase and lipid transport [Botrimarina colliarenosi]|uniref:Polyketide cyclase / dehydrase and lipid transport n=1 Tax=Botrimarina colliarenosi TaxID=2528001 RepID=A0A5C6A3Z0_9BACT|nr:SRPBCC family protein [Botrimarina colliarenosi]TWT94126.1 Polyketide cyclase / dehydrase and lipid transport [Botrimarina colliarenosi]